MDVKFTPALKIILSIYSVIDMLFILMSDRLKTPLIKKKEEKNENKTKHKTKENIDYVTSYIANLTCLVFKPKAMRN